MTLKNLRDFKVQDLIDFFSSIPKEEWTTDTAYNDGRRCAIGHIGNAFGHLTCRSEINIALKEEFMIAGLSNNGYEIHNIIINVNDECCHEFHGDHPKDRVLNLLNYVKEKNEEVKKQEEAVEYVKTLLTEQKLLTYLIENV